MTLLNPTTTKFDFGGTRGAWTLTLSLPVLVLFLYLCSNEEYHLEGININFLAINQIIKTQLIQNWRYYVLNWQCWAIYCGWFFGLAILDLIVPGEWVQGVPLRDGSRLWYLINGKELSLILISIIVARIFMIKDFNLPELTFLYDHTLNFIIISWLFSIGLATVCYAFSFVPLRKPNLKGTHERVLAVGGNSGKPAFDWFIGRELNPRIGYWDIKLFCELRPGMLLWFLLDLGCMQHQYLQLGHITNTLLIVTCFQSFYIFDGVLNEKGCLTMIDITTDGFGFMLAFGDLCWVPFTYSLQARYLSLLNYNLPIWAVIINFVVMICGFWIFKSSNNQKSAFRHGKLKNMKSIKTTRGTELLADGWWGLAQHINYFGDILIASSWCLPTGVHTPLTYFYVIYFSSLLLDRQKRDEAKCGKKYGAAWIEYQKEVPWKIVPYIY